ncbi:MAG: ABC transporter substrate-binding protein [Rhodocyclaceae bacterium]|nr:ABC transporter substrate-binding protein [Rhodocyclaceae bacterium]
MRIPFQLLIAALLAFSSALHAQSPPVVRVALDAEFGNKTSSADDAIRIGMEIAIDEINRAGGVLGGRPLELVTRDNRGVPARGVDNLRELAAMPDMTALFTSKFSPVVLGQLDAAHELHLPLLGPWSAADGIIDHERKPSYSFRLSLKDGWVMPHLLNEAKRRGFERVGLLVPNGAWGRSNQRAADAHVARNPDPVIVKTIKYEWADTSLANEYLELIQAGAQAVLVVGNEPEVGLLVQDMASLPTGQWRPLLSHWGPSAGDLPALAGPVLSKVDLTVVQTFSFIDNPSPRARQVLQAAMSKLGVSEPGRVLSAVGVAHAYDLVHILAMAIDKAGSTDRTRIRDALEHLGAMDGLIRKYDPPFTVGRHEALGPEQLFMARWRRDGAIVRADQ